MTTVGIREFRNHLGRYMGAVKRGQEILLTDRGRIVARISPGRRQEDPMLQKLAPAIAAGTIQPGRIPRPKRPHRPVPAAGKPASQQLIEDRR